MLVRPYTRGVTDAFICAYVRTPFGRYAGALAGLRPDAMAAHVMRAVVERSGIDPADLDDVILGNANQVTTFGVSWYVNRWIKIQANIIREKLDDPSQGPLPSKASFTSKAIRFQFSL